MKPKLQIGFRVLVGVAAYSFIALRLGGVGFSKFPEVFSGLFTADNASLLLVTLFLMLLVWGLEAYKWEYAVSQFSSLSIWEAWRSVWYGLAVGQFTPNRTGEPFGRIALLNSETRGKALAAAFWCSFSQQVVTLVFGVFAIFVWLFEFNFSFDVIRLALYVLFLLILLWGIVLFVFLCRFTWLLDWLQKFKFIKNTLHGEKLTFNVSGTYALSIIGISAIRYLIFSTQYVILLKLLGVDASVYSLYIAVMLNYLFITFIPSFAASELGVRLGAAIGFVGMLSDNLAGITAAALSLWIINIVLPVFMAVWFKWEK